MKPGGLYFVRMEAKNGTIGFDFIADYDKIETNKSIQYTIRDGRKVDVQFKIIDKGTEEMITFDVEDENSIQLRHEGWQTILNNFKKYSETFVFNWL